MSKLERRGAFAQEGFGASYTKLWGMPLLLLLVVRSPVITGFWPSLGVTGLDLGVLTLLVTDGRTTTYSYAHASTCPGNFRTA